MVPTIRHATLLVFAVTLVSFAALAVLHAPSQATGFKLYTLPPCSPVRQPRVMDYLGNMVVLEISSSDTLHINGSAFALSQMTPILDLVYHSRASKDLFLAVDQQISYERFVSVLDRMQGVPLHHLVLLTRSSAADLKDDTCLFDWKKW